MKFSIGFAIVLWAIAKVSAEWEFEGIAEPTYPPSEIFGSGTQYRFRWSEKSNSQTGLCLIDWSAPDSTLQPFGTRRCTDYGEKADQGAHWALSYAETKDKTGLGPVKDFVGLVGNMGTGRCMEWKWAPANETAHTSPYKNTTTYGNLTSEICDKKNKYQYFKLKDWKNSEAHLNFLPLMWNETCLQGQRPTIIAGPEHSLVAYGCSKGLWIPDVIGAKVGWFYYDDIQEHRWRQEGNSDRYQTIRCCQKHQYGLDQESIYCKEAMRKEGQGQRTPAEFWMQTCTALFPNYPKIQRMRSRKRRAVRLIA
ncbi:hypothetical protein TWF281_007243 [Arthrobotrys megalospora]